MSPLQSLESCSHAVAALLNAVRTVVVVLDAPYPAYANTRIDTPTTRAHERFRQLRLQYRVPDDLPVWEAAAMVLRAAMGDKQAETKTDETVLAVDECGHRTHEHPARLLRDLRASAAHSPTPKSAYAAAFEREMAVADLQEPVAYNPTPKSAERKVGRMPELAAPFSSYPPPLNTAPVNDLRELDSGEKPGVM